MSAARVQKAPECEPPCGRTTHRKSKLCSAPAIKRFRQMFKREVMNADHDGTGSKRRSGKLNMQHVDWIISQLGAER